jgi:hypothetical protein
MLTTKQKFHVAAFGGALMLQGVVLANIARVGFDMANAADTLAEIVKKHVADLDADDLQALKKLNLMD